MSTQKNFCLTVNARASQHYNERLPALHVAQLGTRSSPAYTSRSWARAVRPPTRCAVGFAQFARLHVARQRGWVGGRSNYKK